MLLIYLTIGVGLRSARSHRSSAAAAPTPPDATRTAEIRVYDLARL